MRCASWVYRPNQPASSLWMRSSCFVTLCGAGLLLIGDATLETIQADAVRAAGEYALPGRRLDHCNCACLCGNETTTTNSDGCGGADGRPPKPVLKPTEIGPITLDIFERQ
jgi:hypothetical protein